MASAAQSGVEVDHCILAGIELELQDGALGCRSHPTHLSDMHRPIHAPMLRATPLPEGQSDGPKMCPSSCCEGEVGHHIPCKLDCPRKCGKLRGLSLALTSWSAYRVFAPCKLHLEHEPGPAEHRQLAVRGQGLTTRELAAVRTPALAVSAVWPISTATSLSRVSMLCHCPAALATCRHTMSELPLSHLQSRLAHHHCRNLRANQ